MAMRPDTSLSVRVLFVLASRPRSPLNRACYGSTSVTAPAGSW